MEPFGAEECHSSESGWTMYIGSSIDDAGGHSTDDGDGDDDNDDDDKEEGTQAHPQDDDESDDSMASDASSGPSHHHGFADFRRDSEEGNHDKYCFEKKASKTQHKQGRHSMKLAKAKELWNYGIKFEILKFLRLANITKTQNLRLS